MKALYLLLMFSTSSIIGLYYGYMMKEREVTLIELNKFFKYLVIKISSKGGTLLNFVVAYKGSRSTKAFLSVLTQELAIGSMYPFETAAKELYALKPEDTAYINAIGIGSLDYNGQIKALENAICYFDSEIKEDARENKKHQIVSYSGVLVGLALVIIFI